jgi:hypothetical protein
MTDLFVEIFPLQPESIPALFAYRLDVLDGTSPAQINRIGNRLATALEQLSGDTWLWSQGHLVTGVDYQFDDIKEALAQLKNDHPEPYAALNDITPAPTSPQIQADTMLRTVWRTVHEPMRNALREDRIGNATVEREHRLQPWVINGEPAVSVSIASRLIYDKSIAAYVGEEKTLAALNDKLGGLWASHRQTGRRGEIVKVISAGDDPLLQIKGGRRDQEIPASQCRLIVRLSHLRQFNDVAAKQAINALQMRPATRAKHIKAVSNVAKDAGLIGNAYNARIQTDHFFSADFEMNLRFDDNRVRPYNAETLSVDFLQCGVYQLRKAFKKAPIRVCVVNTLTFRMKDFAEALQRQLQRHFDFSIEVVRERQVKVISPTNLMSAIRAVEKENPDIILAFFPDETDTSDEDATETTVEGENSADFIRSTTLGRGIPTHLISETILNDPDAMPSIIMAILGKTGNAPFVLTEPVQHADLVTGLDIVRRTHKSTQETTLTAIARIYQADGEFMRYRVSDMQLEDNKPPYPLVRDLFPQVEFAGKRVVIHHDGPLPADFLAALSIWAGAIKATFYPVEILRFGAPRIYATGKGVIQPPWGSAFKLSDTEALLISSLPKDDVTPQPLHIRTVSAGAKPLAIEKALRGVLVWTLLAYGAERMPKLPVTVINAAQLAYWLEIGGSLNADDGDVPFWL